MVDVLLHVTKETAKCRCSTCTSTCTSTYTCASTCTSTSIPRLPSELVAVGPEGKGEMVVIPLLLPLVQQVGCSDDHKLAPFYP